jgi:enoyl-CoA hydratase/carnithine racemase
VTAEQVPTDTVLFEVEGRVATITLNRPEAMNSLSRALSRGVADAFRRVQEDPEIRVAILTGRGRAFCAGADLKERAATEASGASGIGPIAQLVRPAAGSGAANVAKPVIAAVNGYCLGGGMEMALQCDILIASNEASFGLPEISHGFFPGGGGPQRLPRMIPRSMAMEMLFTGDRVDAATAYRVGLISRLTTPEELLPTAQQLASRIARHAPLALAALKEVAYSSQETGLGHSLRFGSLLRWVIGQTEDAREGPRAFVERREPSFKGQ